MTIGVGADPVAVRHLSSASRPSLGLMTRAHLHGAPAALLAGFLSASSPVQAQQRPMLHAGTAVRVWIPALDVPIRGTLFTWSNDSIWMFVDSAQARAFAFDDLAILELYRGRHPALTIGSAVAGGVLGAMLGPAILTDDDRCQAGVVDDPDCRHLTSDVMIGVAVGAVALGTFGRWIASERWREIPLHRLSVGVRRREDGAWVVGVRAAVLQW